MKYEKGKSGNYSGRPKGSKNRTPEEVRQLLQSFIEANINTLQAEFNKLSSEKKLLFFEKLLSHCLPRPQNELERLTDEQLNEILEKFKPQNK